MSSRRNKRPYKGLILKPKPLKPGSVFATGTGTRTGLGTVSVSASPLALTSTTATTIISFQNGQTYNVPNSGNVSPSTSSTSTNSLVTKQHIKKSLQNDFKLKSTANTNNNDTDNNIPSHNGSNGFGVVGDLYDISDPNNFNEFEFLYSIYVPNKYLIKNNKKSIKHLLIHLPKLYHDSATNSSGSTTSTTTNTNQTTNLNLSIHLFLSTIMVKFVNSWYLTKLNTTNLLFLKLVYQLMVDFIRDIISRIESVDIMLMIDQLGDILNTHLKQTVSNKYSGNNQYPYKFLEDYYFIQQPTSNTFDFDKLSLQVVNDHLKSNHIIFENFNSSKDQNTNNEMLYYRLLVKNVLLASFKDNALSPSTSKITSDLIIHILSDIVIVKLIEKLSSLDFIFDKLNELLDSLLSLSSSSSSSSSSNSIEPNSKVKLESTFYLSWTQKLQKSISQIYSGFTSFIVLSSNSKKSQLKGNENGDSVSGTNSQGNGTSGVLNWSLFSLLNIIFNVQHRKPFVYNLMISIKTLLLQMNNRIVSSIDRITGEFIKTKIKQSITQDKVARIINDLRINLFYPSLDNQESKTVNQENQISIDILAEKIIKVYKTYFAKYLDLSYKGETDQDLKDSIKLVLIIFQQQQEHKEEKESDPHQYLDNRVNKLLIVKLLDCVIGNLYTDI